MPNDWAPIVWSIEESAMWIMLVVALNIHCDEGGVACQARQNSSPSVTAVEFSSRDRCIAAVKFTIKRSKIQDAFCVQK